MGIRLELHSVMGRFGPVFFRNRFCSMKLCAGLAPPIVLGVSLQAHRVDLPYLIRHTV